jgi:DNA-binding transcriptional ArsR family regulator
MSYPTDARFPGLAFTALADPTRRRIVEILSERGPQRVSDVTARLPVTRQAVSKHLDVLSAAGITATERQGRERITRLAEGAFEPLKDWLVRYDRFWSESLASLKKQIEGRDRE